jgi:hypothetical protein
MTTLYDEPGVPLHEPGLTDSRTVDLLHVLREAKCFFAVGGSLAIRSYNVPIRVKDIDLLFTHSGQVQEALAALKACSFPPTYVAPTGEGSLHLRVGCSPDDEYLSTDNHPLAVDLVTRSKTDGMYLAHLAAIEAAMPTVSPIDRRIRLVDALLFKLWAGRPKDVLALTLIVRHLQRVEPTAVGVFQTHVLKHLGDYGSRMLRELVLEPLRVAWDTDYEDQR